jgi:hypothetical protein
MLSKNHLPESEQILLIVLLWLIPVAAILAGMLAYVSIVSSLRLSCSCANCTKITPIQGPRTILPPNYIWIFKAPQVSNLAMLSPGVMPIVFTGSWFSKGL